MHDDEVRSARCNRSSINSLPCPSDECAVRQRSWDASGVTRQWITIWKDSLGELDLARFIALKAPHSSDWLFAFQLPFVVSVYPTNLSGLLSVYVSVSIFVNLTPVHVVQTLAREEHTVFHVKRSRGLSTRHYEVSDLMWRSLWRADIPTTEETTGK